MKMCSRCQGFALYEDDKQSCPACGEALVPFVRRNAPAPAAFRSTEGSGYAGRGDAQPTYASFPPAPAFETGGQPFESVSGRTHVIRGRIAEMTPVVRYQTRAHKLINALFRGDPYQFGHGTHSMWIRIEEETSGRLPEHVRDVVAFGDFEGRLQIGSDVTVRVKHRGDRYIARHIFMHDTMTTVRPGLQLPAVLFRLLAAAVALLLVTLINAVANGSLLRSLGEFLPLLLGAVFTILSPLLPLVVVVGIVWYLFRRRRR